jgi:hypothetical protein
MPLGQLPRSSCIKAALLTSALLFEHVLRNSEGSSAGLAAATLGLADLHSQLTSVIERLRNPDPAAIVISALTLQPQQEEEACRTGLAAVVDMQAQVILHVCRLHPSALPLGQQIIARLWQLGRCWFYINKVPCMLLCSGAEAAHRCSPQGRGGKESRHTG